tara:strand:- start:1 stop:213 length:213 start_codon:yes stop_codon:yes gene_type:complete
MKEEPVEEFNNKFDDINTTNPTSSTSTTTTTLKRKHCFKFWNFWKKEWDWWCPKETGIYMEKIKKIGIFI